RLLSSAFLHANWPHLLYNAYALFVVGSLVEHAYGRTRFFVIYILSALAGSLASFALTDSMAVGASGAIFGLMGAAILSLKRGQKTVAGVLGSRNVAAL